MAHITATVRPLAAAESVAKLLPTISLMRGAPSVTRTNGEPA